MKHKRKTHNVTLPFIIPDWQGNALDHKHRYVNLGTPSERGYKDVLAWKVKGNTFKKEKKNQYCNVNVVMDEAFYKDRHDGFTWLGHASFYFTLDGKNILIDPVLKNVGPLKRHTPLPCDVKNLSSIDVLLISHNHRDHLDKKSIRSLCKLNPEAVIYTGLEIGKILRKWKIENPIIEAGWYQSYPLIDTLQIHYLPSKHWNRRGLSDLNEMLWGSFIIQSTHYTLYFGADSGIDDHFDQIGTLFPSIDYAFIGIGAYEPNWFMRASHTNPSEALEAFRMLKAGHLVPMHYGTFDLSDEPLHLPKDTLLQLVDEQSLHDQVHFMDIGRKKKLK